MERDEMIRSGLSWWYGKGMKDSDNVMVCRKGGEEEKKKYDIA
jgi:hypothetical protein